MSVQTGFHFDSDDTARQLRRYVDDVLDAAGLSGYGYIDHVDGAWSAYVAVDGRVAGFPNHDVALLWDQDDGWSVAAENPADGSLVVIDRLSGPRRSPAAVARWVRSVLRHQPPQAGSQRRLVS